MAKLDPELLYALRKSRAAIKRLRAAVGVLGEASGWWGDVDGYFERKLAEVAREALHRAALLEAELDESYPRRGTPPPVVASKESSEFGWTPLHLRGGDYA